MLVCETEYQDKDLLCDQYALKLMTFTTAPTPVTSLPLLPQKLIIQLNFTAKRMSLPQQFKFTN